MTTLMVQGTTSDAGKSTLVAGLCRCLMRRGVSVAPFKPQNMALNSAVTPEGGEIGRAQALQAQACGLQAHTDMNPVLLKPTTDTGAQVIIHGKALLNMDARQFHNYKAVAMSAVLESHGRLAEAYELVVVEGAGSPAEINLRDRDIANMGFAEAVDCPVIIVADIDRGGVFAHLVGTLALLSQSEQDRVIGFVINRFRGDISLLDPGLKWLEERTAKPVLGVLPFLHGLHLDAEDALPLEENQGAPASQADRFRVCVPALPRISNHTDFDPLRIHPQIDFRFVGPHESIPSADLIILPGSKSVRQDLAWLRAQGWDKAIERHLRYGGKVLGICGGFQMLGQKIVDENGLEGQPGASDGLGFLDCETHLFSEKVLTQRKGRLSMTDAAVSGYEIHVGRTQGPGLDRPLIYSAEGDDGAISLDEQVIGTYWHGLFEQAEALSAILHWAGLRTDIASDYASIREAQLTRLADTLEQHIDIVKLQNEVQRFASERSAVMR